MNLLTAGLLGAASPEEKLAEMEISLPAVAPAVANYVSAVQTGNLVVLAGHIPRDDAGNVITGRVPSTSTPEEAKAAAQRTAIALLATLKAEIGDLSRVNQIVRVDGFVRSDDDFTGQSGVINGCSDLLVAVFGEAGRHTRTAIGTNALPLGTVVEIAMVVELKN
jgi:enamine deaminase RidA (YjgF/YER057c/UK114 family)